MARMARNGAHGVHGEHCARHGVGERIDLRMVEEPSGPQF